MEGYGENVVLIAIGRGPPLPLFAAGRPGSPNSEKSDTFQSGKNARRY